MVKSLITKEKHPAIVGEDSSRKAETVNDDDNGIEKAVNNIHDSVPLVPLIKDQDEINVAEVTSTATIDDNSCQSNPFNIGGCFDSMIDEVTLAEVDVINNFFPVLEEALQFAVKSVSEDIQSAFESVETH